MRKSFLLSGAFMCLVWMSVSCTDMNDDDITIKINDTETTYSMYAHFGHAKTKKVLEYMDKKLGNKNNISFVNSKIDATLTLDDRSTFYMKSDDGELKIKLDKEANSYENYSNIKGMCEGIKEVLK